MDRQKFVSDWIKKGEAEGDAFNKFFSYYVAFNFLYNRDFEDINSERERIVLFVATQINSPKFKNFKLNSQQYEEMSKQQILDMKSNRPSKLYKQEDLVSGNIISVFMAIYQIRCNLFHGGKELSLKRNINLVEEAAEIIKLFLEKYWGANK